MKKKIKTVIICSVLFLLVIFATVFSISEAKSRQTSILDISKNQKTPILSAQPTGIVGVCENQSLKVTAVAIKNAKVSFSVGAKRYKAKKTESYDQSYDVYKATVKLPQSKMEIESIGVIKVVAVINETAYTLSAFQVYYIPKQTSYISSNEQESLSQTTLKAQNYVSEESTAKEETTKTTMTAAVSEYVPSTNSQIIPETTGGLMAVVTGCAADTWPGENDDTTFIPYLTPLAVGTMDYITGEMSVYDSDAGKTRDFYNLSSGVRVLKSSVQTGNYGNLGDNNISTISSYSQSGNLYVILSESWKVPYKVDLSPQQYYKAHGKKYNVSTFYPTTLTFTFYHTVSAGGSVDVSGSDIISNAVWSTDPYSKTATLTLTLKSAGVYYGYSVSYDENGNFVLMVHNKPQSLSQSVILLDPGHGGTDSGALGFDGGVYESSVNFANAVELKYELERRGATVYLTRYDDLKVTLEERKNMATALKPDFFISLHCDGNEDKSVYGTSAFYYKPMSQALSQSIHNEMIKVYSSYIYASDPIRAQNAQRGSKYHPFSVTRLEDCPSVLIETGYVTNYEECSILIKEETRKKIAVAIADGIEKFILSK